MTIRNGIAIPVLVALFLVAGCGAAPSLIQLRGTLTSVDPVGGSVEEYGVQRARIVAEMKTALAEARGMEKSRASKIKKIVAGAGAVIALGSTVGSLVVDDTDTQSTIAQAGAGIAGAAGVAALLPFGSGAEGARNVTTFLEFEIPRFQARWPETVATEVPPQDWAAFRADAEDMAAALERLTR